MAHKVFFNGKRLSQRNKQGLIEVLRFLNGPESDKSVDRCVSVTASCKSISPAMVEQITKDFIFTERNLKSQDPVLWSAYLDEMNRAEDFMKKVNQARKVHTRRGPQLADGVIAFDFD